MDALIPAGRTRASVISHRGGAVYASVHEAEVARQRSVWMRRLADAHPDRAGGSTTAFVRLRRQYEAWKTKDSAWWGHHAPPTPRSRARTHHEVVAALHAPVRSVCRVLYRNALRARRARRGHGATARERVLGVLLDAQPHTVADVCVRAGIPNRSALNKAMHRLRAAGVPVHRISTGRTFAVYQLILPAKKDVRT
jgi:hypothetical protein